MRTRKTLAVLALALALAGCGGEEAGPTPKGAGEATTPDALATKLRAYTADTCFSAPEKQVPKGCEKYVTELGGSVGMVRQLAGAKHPELNTLADGLDKAVGAYRSAHCDTATNPGTPCSTALRDIATSLRDIKQAVDTQVATG
ncbi:hypothetical protein LWP59_04510 [Amycolatopsis acidiphila]|uniref:Secreted protein n=1 Tax=Amycolatopsis acidiphila TaxID=715473 RepID=A0A558A0E2_9PSEU|nr:hypothetical protein [Amycolatopsis acidiphila]TVT17733.1 hypothetical protein FNH06_30250 [Amycolatopsis acidiphila]UIJ60938.1 hypothetical protein LWP59_04510 [Amycolatopsis acidiphila]